MLDFHLGMGGIEDIGKHIGGLSSEAIYWLQQNNFLVRGTTGHRPEDPIESLPIGDDVVLTHAQVQNMYDRFTLQLEKASKTPGFKSKDVQELGKILELAIENKSGLSTVAD
jgi:hypothetical protein